MSQRSINILKIHRENLLGTKTFEEYRDAHIAYIDMLIEQLLANLKKDDSVVRWMALTDKSGVAIKDSEGTEDGDTTS